MSRKHYVQLARVMGDGLAIAALAGGEQSRTAFYESCYRPLVDMLAADNAAFDMTRFSYATAQAESAYIEAHNPA
jgi:hypothetical protein